MSYYYKLGQIDLMNKRKLDVQIANTKNGIVELDGKIKDLVNY